MFLFVFFYLFFFVDRNCSIFSLVSYSGVMMSLQILGAGGVTGVTNSLTALDVG